MNAPQLFCVFALALSVSACHNRSSQAELKQTAGQTADRIRTESVKAGEKLEDVWLAAKIRSKFVGDREIKARDIKVSVENGMVTLQGHVLNESEHQLALTLARNTDGAKQVVDHLDVQVAGPPPLGAVTGGTPGAAATNGTSSSPSTPSSSATPSTPPVGSPIASSDDARITTSIQSKYFMDDRIKGRHINVTTNAGVVTLNGEIADETERAEALLLARTTEGVKRVEDNLTISPASTGATAAPGAPVAGPNVPTAETARKPGAAAPDADAALADRIRSQLASDAQVKNVSLDSIDVTARSGVVQLEGTVPTSAAKQRALALTRSTDGVTQVVDRIEVSTPKSSPPKTAAARKAKK